MASGKDLQFSKGGWTAVQNVAAHSMVGGVASVLQGGKFGHGFLSSMISNSMKGFMDPSSADAWGNEYSRTIVAGIVGGTVSELTGGKFANGALTSALQWWFNSEDRGRVEQRKDIQKLLNQRFNYGKLDNSNADQQKLFRQAVSKGFNYLGIKEHEFKFADLIGSEARVNQWRELAIDSTKIALNDVSNLLSVLGHENVHMNQPHASIGTPQWFRNEIQAHNWELNNAALTGLKDSNRINDIKNCIALYSKENFC